MPKNPDKKRAARTKKKKPGRGERFSEDVLSRYLREISKIKPLTREEEYHLSKEIRDGNSKALQELVRRNLKYVVTVANKFKGFGLSFQDLIEEGNIGLIQAAKRFDPERHVKFITYAVWWIRQAVMHYLAEQTGAVRVPIKQVGKIYKIGRELRSLTQNLDREPTFAEVAAGMGIREEELENLMRAHRTHLSLDTPLSSDQDTSYLELLENPNYIPYDDQMILDGLSRQIDGMLHDLDPREEKILRMRYGFGGDCKTLEEIGEEIGLSRERVRQIEKRAKSRLKSKLLSANVKE